MKDMSDGEVIDDVTFLGGATEMNSPKHSRMFAEVPTGCIRNCYASNDMILSKLFRVSSSKIAIGLNPIWEKRVENHNKSVLGTEDSIILGPLDF